jgi:hypothetical protein
MCLPTYLAVSRTLSSWQAYDKIIYYNRSLHAYVWRRPVAFAFEVGTRSPVPALIKIYLIPLPNRSWRPVVLTTATQWIAVWRHGGWIFYDWSSNSAYSICCGFIVEQIKQVEYTAFDLLWTCSIIANGRRVSQSRDCDVHHCAHSPQARNSCTLHTDLYAGLYTSMLVWDRK